MNLHMHEFICITQLLFLENDFSGRLKLIAVCCMSKLEIAKMMTLFKPRFEQNLHLAQYFVVVELKWRPKMVKIIWIKFCTTS